MSKIWSPKKKLKINLGKENAFHYLTSLKKNKVLRQTEKNFSLLKKISWGFCKGADLLNKMALLIQLFVVRKYIKTRHLSITGILSTLHWPL